MDLYTEALMFAAMKHDGQLRKYTGEPYITHPIAVAEIVRAAGGTPEMIAAALLHDVLEDTCTERGTLDILFGPVVGAYVEDLSDFEIGPRKIRKELSRARLGAACAEVQTIKLADLAHNTESIVEHDPKFAKVYLKEKWDLLGVLTKGYPNLHRHVTIQCADAYHSLSKEA